MKQCFGYVRVSTVKQGEGVSLEAQREAIERFAAQNNITIKHWFEEKETAAKSGRPGFNSMLKQLRQGRADGLVIHKIDRSARNFRDWANIGELSDAGIDVHFANESLDFRSRGGRLSADIQAVIAADYVRNLREECIKGIRGRLKQGLYPFAAPIGYLDNGSGKPKTLDPVRAPLVKRAFELYASGQFSIKSLEREMDVRGLQTRNGRAASKRCIENMLSNPFYCSLIRLKRTGEIFEGTHKKLISAKLFETVQAVKSGKAIKRVTRHDFSYRSLFQCNLCTATMHPERQKGHVYYRCHNPDCPTKCVREERIEQKIIAVLQKVRFSEPHLEYISNAVQQWCQKSASPELAKTHAMQLQQVDNQLEKLDDAAIEKIIDQQNHGRRKKELLLKRTRLEEAKSNAGKMRTHPATVRKFFERLKNLAEHYIFAAPNEKRQIVEIATSNRRLSMKNVYLEPANWLLATQNALCVPYGGPQRTTFRTNQELNDQQIEQLIELSLSDEAGEIQVILDSESNRTTHL